MSKDLRESIIKFVERIDDSIIECVSDLIVHGYTHNIDVRDISGTIRAYFKRIGTDSSLYSMIILDAMNRADDKLTDPGSSIDYPGAKRRDDIHATRNIDERGLNS